MLFVVDLDGTVADCMERLPLLYAGKEEAFYKNCVNDIPITNVITAVEALYRQGATIVFLTARPELSRPHTTAWIKSFINIPRFGLLMRPDGDKREDYTYKIDTLVENKLLPHIVTAVLEDRTSVVKVLRDEGYTVFQTAAGDY